MPARSSALWIFPGATVFTSCEPCALCVAAMEITEIARVVLPPRSPTAPEPWPACHGRSGAAGMWRRCGGRPGAIGQGARIVAREALTVEAITVLEAWAAPPG